MPAILETRSGSTLLAEVSFASDYLLLQNGWISNPPVLMTSGNQRGIRSCDFVIDGKRILVDNAGIMDSNNTTVNQTGSFWLWLDVNMGTGVVNLLITTTQSNPNPDSTDIYINTGGRRTVNIATITQGVYRVVIPRAGGNIVDQVYPVGAAYWGSGSVNPSQLFPGTTWRSVDSGSFVMISDANIIGSNDFSGQQNAVSRADVNGVFTSAATVLQTTHLPPHTHTVGAHTHPIGGTAGQMRNWDNNSDNVNTGSTTPGATGSNGAHTHGTGRSGQNNFVLSNGRISSRDQGVNSWVTIITGGRYVPFLGPTTNGFDSAEAQSAGAHTHTSAAHTHSMTNHRHNLPANTGASTAFATANGPGTSTGHVHTINTPIIRLKLWIRTS